MSSMFFGSSEFNYPIDTWNTSSVTDMSNMFKDAPLFNQNISSWNVGAVTNMGEMFRRAIAFNQNLSAWVTALSAQPPSFSTDANATFRNNANNLKPFLAGGVTRINT